jgi:4-hydroxybenzoate polyprenyltransferase
VEVAFHPPGALDIALLAGLFLGIVLPFVLVPRKAVELIKLLRPARIIHYAGFAAGGAVMGAAVGKVALDPYLLFYSTLAGASAFQGAVFLNDIFDVQIDRIVGKKTPFSKGILGCRGSYILTIGLSVASLLLVLCCGIASFFALLGSHIVSLTYSTPPIRAKRFYPLNVFLLAAAGFSVMVSGFASHAPIVLFPPRMVVLVLVTLTASFGTKDIADVEGDRRRGIHTLFTLLGLRVGRWVNAGLVGASYLAAPLILGYLKLYWAAVPAGAITTLAILAPKPREWLILVVYILFGLTVLGLIAAGEIF